MQAYRLEILIIDYRSANAIHAIRSVDIRPRVLLLAKRLLVQAESRVRSVRQSVRPSVGNERENVEKRLTRSRCRLGSWVGWAQGTIM